MKRKRPPSTTGGMTADFPPPAAKAGVVKRRRKRPPITKADFPNLQFQTDYHYHDEVYGYARTLLEQTQLRPGGQLSEKIRQYMIMWLAANALRAPQPQKNRPPEQRAESFQKQAQEWERRREREAFYVLLRARYFVAVVSRSAKKDELPLKKGDISGKLIGEAVKKFDMGRKAIENEVRIASFYDASNHKFKDWVASIRKPQGCLLPVRQERLLPVRVAAQVAKLTNYREIQKLWPDFVIFHHRPLWTSKYATARAAKVAVRVIKCATAGVEWPDAETKQLFADFNEDIVRDHFKKHFPTIIKREQAAPKAERATP